MSTEFDNLQQAEGQENQVNLEATTTENPIEIQVDNLVQDEQLITEVQQLELPSIDYHSLEFNELHHKTEELINKFPVYQVHNTIKEIQDIVRTKISEDKELKLSDFNLTKKENEEFSYENLWDSKFKSLFSLHKKQLDTHYKEKEKQFQQNLEKRKVLIEELKSLYTNPPATNSEVFKKFKEIKEKWHHAGSIPKTDADNIFRTYFFHLDNFYSYLNLNKELQALDYAHNLENRKTIIKRAKELLQEENLFKALNELQYLHKLWKESAEPVSDEFKETTWNEFKDLTNQIHDKKNSWLETLKEEETLNLQKKNEIIDKIKSIVYSSEATTHKSLQNRIQEVEKLRTKFFEVGKVPKENTNEIWSVFKTIFRDFNVEKNKFYKELKSEQNENLQKKNELIKIAVEHKDSENWNEALEIFKKIQNEWKNIGHVPKKLSDEKWKEFKETCNYFFERFKNRNKAELDEFKKNLLLKKAILEELDVLKIDKKQTKDEKLDKIRILNQQWNAIGKVPRENISINKVFEKLSKEIISKLELTDEETSQIDIELKLENIITNNDERGLDSEIKRLRKQIQDLEIEISTLDNNLSFFAVKDKNNPLVKDSYARLDKKKAELNKLKERYNTVLRLDLTDSKE